MKKTLLVIVLITGVILIPSLTSFAGFRLPFKTFNISELEEAKAKAKTTGKPIAFLYSDKNTSCGLCSKVSKLMIEQLRLITIMVYLKSKSGVPRIVSKALSREGKYIPKVVVFDDEIKDEIGLVYYEMAKQNGTKAFRSLKKEIQKYTRRKRKQLREKYY